MHNNSPPLLAAMNALAEAASPAVLRQCHPSAGRRGIAAAGHGPDDGRRACEDSEGICVGGASGVGMAGLA